MKVNGKMIFVMDLENMSIMMDINMKVSGLMINSIVMELQKVQMEQYILENMLKVKNREKEKLFFQTKLLSKENTLKIRFKEKDYILGMTIHMKVNLRPISWMEKVNSNGMMAEFMKVVIPMIRKKVRENWHGQMEEPIMETGQKENKTVKGLWLIKLVFQQKIYGKQVKK